MMIEEVADFKHLGPTLTVNGQAKDEIVTGMTIARNAFGNETFMEPS